MLNTWLHKSLFAIIFLHVIQFSPCEVECQYAVYVTLDTFRMGVTLHHPSVCLWMTISTKTGVPNDVNVKV